MSNSSRMPVTTRAWLSAWAFLTLILFFTVILLAGELITRGHNPLDVAFQEKEPPPPQAAAEGSGRTAEIPLRFADADGSLLGVETRRVELTDHLVDNCKTALTELLKGPGAGLTPLFPPVADPAAGVHAVYLVEGGVLIVDLAHEVLPDARIASASSESLLIYGVVNTLTHPVLRGPNEDASVARVRFLVDGSAPSDAFPIHLDLSQPVAPNAQWNAGSEAQPSSNA